MTHDTGRMTNDTLHKNVNFFIEKIQNFDYLNWGITKLKEIQCKICCFF